MSNLFSNEKVNTGRQLELDIAKALSIIFHVFSSFGNGCHGLQQFNYSRLYIYNQ